MNDVSAADDQAESTSTDLLRQVILGDQLAWAQFVDAYSPLIYSRCRARGVQAQDAADLVQEVLRRVFKSIAEFRRDQPGQGLRRWLRTIAGNVINDHFRRQATLYPEAGAQVSLQYLSQLADESISSGTDANSPDESRSAGTRSLKEVLALIRIDYETTTWQAFWMTVVEGHPTADVARDLNLTPGAIRQARYKILKRLRELLENG